MSDTVTAAEITAILGPIDPSVLADIQRSGASAAEILEAFTRLENDEAVGPVAQRGVSAKVAEVMAILEAELRPEEE